MDTGKRKWEVPLCGRVSSTACWTQALVFDVMFLINLIFNIDGWRNDKAVVIQKPREVQWWKGHSQTGTLNHNSKLRKVPVNIRDFLSLNSHSNPAAAICIQTH